MSEQTINSFSKGMIKDISDTVRAPESYEDAHDIKIRGLEGSTDYIVSNIKGNKLMFTVPDVPQIAKLKTRGGDFPDSWNFPPEIIVNGNTITANISISQGSGGTIDNFFDQFENSLKTDPAFTTYNLIIKRVGSTIRVWSESYNIALNTTSLTTFFSSYPNVTIDTQAAQTTQQIIGWTTVGDNIYLYSTNASSAGVASIWKLVYDDATLVPVITLMYSENLNMGTLNPIANPGGIESILENTKTERLYWTDRINPLRTINIIDENAMCFSPEDLDLRLTSNLEKPALLIVENGGSLITGVYQVAYNLRNSDGAITSYSHTSNSIDIIKANYSSYEDIEGNENGILTGKAINIQIENIDTTYEFLDIAVLRKETENSTAVISKITDIPISNSTFNYIITGNEPASNITEIDFNRIAIFFEKCHTIAQKDNILFAANTEERTFDVEFDARAYRFDDNLFCQLADIQNNTEVFTPSQILSQPFYIPETEDAINPEQAKYKYQSDGVTLGGEGVNVSYTFTTGAVEPGSIGLSADARDALQERKTWSYPWNIPFQSGGGTNTILNDGIIYGEQPTFANYKSPTAKHEFRGYRRGETYRFAWVPVKDGVEGFAKWIADIKMPEIFEGGPNGYDEDYNYFPLTYDANVKWQVRPLGIEFSVTIPANIANQIDTFRIKRVKLEQHDRTILGQGILHQSLRYYEKHSDSTPGDYHPIAGVDDGTLDNNWGLNANPNSFAVENSNFQTYNQETSNPFTWDNGQSFNSSRNTDYYTQSIMSFHSPDFLFGKAPQHRSGDFIKVIGGLAEWAHTFEKDPSEDENSHVNAFKLYEYSPVNWMFSTTPHGVYEPMINRSVIDALPCSLGGTVQVNGKTYRNHSAPMSVIAFNGQQQNVPDYGGVTNGWASWGTDTYVIDIEHRGFPAFGYIQAFNGGTPTSFVQGNNSGPYFNGSVYEPTSVDPGANGKPSSKADKIVANYMRPKIDQYGGKGYTARSKNSYINTGCNIVMNGQTTFNDIKVFGGDTFINIFDTYKMLRNFEIDDEGDRTGTMLYYPTENYVNTDLREGLHISGELGGLNRFYGGSDPNPSAEDYPLDYGEDFKYNYLFSEEMDTQRSFPKPISFEEINDHPHRIWASNKKTHGERIDTWRQFDNEKYIDVQGDLGEIRQLLNLNGTLIAWQKFAIGVPSVNERSILNDQSGSGIVLGKSGILPRFDYISQTVGSWHQFSFAISPYGVIFFDSKDGSVYLYTQKGLINITEQKINNWLYANTRDNLLNYDAPYISVLTKIGGITSTYDYVNKEFLITIYNSKGDAVLNEDGTVTLPVDNSYTLAYSEPLNTFVSYRSYKPIMYINDKKHIISPKPQLTLPTTSSKLYIHEEGNRGVFYDNDPSESSITITVNKEPYVTKIFDNIRWLTEVFNNDGTEASGETFSEAEIYNTYQTTGTRTVFKRLMREWKHAIAYAENSKNRLRSHYIKQKFKFLNNNDKELRLHYITNLFRRIMK